MEKIKKIANFRCLNNSKAFNPKAREKEVFFSPLHIGGHLGNVNAYIPKIIDTTPAI